MVTESDNIVAETAARIFADLADPQTINRARDTDWKEKLWRALSQAGLTLAWVPEQQGGAGASLAEGFAILGAALLFVGWVYYMTFVFLLGGQIAQVYDLRRLQAAQRAVLH